MALCEKCGKTYLTKECLNCKNNYSKNTLNEKDKLYKTIRYAIIFFIGLIIIGGLTDLYIINKTVKASTPIFKSLNTMTNTMNEAMKKINKRQFNQEKKYQN
jgi:hypothetical protein